MSDRCHPHKGKHGEVASSGACNLLREVYQSDCGDKALSPNYGEDARPKHSEKMQNRLNQSKPLDLPHLELYEADPHRTSSQSAEEFGQTALGKTVSAETTKWLKPKRDWVGQLTRRGK